MDGFAEYDKPITLEDIEFLRSIGRKSINDFTPADIKKAQKWAYKFYKELGVKSPFFRAWFGDWRAHDRSNVTEILEMERKAGKNPRGAYKNRDTGWFINSSSVGYDETVSHSGKDKKSLIAMRNIDKFIENAILLDTEVSEYGRGKKSIYTAFMHKLYAPIRIDGKMYLAKLSVEESSAPGQNQIDKKFYHVRAIEIETASSVGIGKSHTPIIEDTASNISISDLFELVKTYDTEFSPKAVNPLLLNEDGTPKVFYHGTNEVWTEYDLSKNINQMYGEGIYLTPNPERARLYGDIVMPFYVRATTDFREARKTGAAIDYTFVAKTGDIVVKSPEQIKSATDNIGTFSRGTRDIRASRPLSEAVGEIATSAIAADLTGPRSLGTRIKEGAIERVQELSSMPLSAQIQFVNEQAGIENAAVKMGVARNKIESAVQMVRNSAAQAQYLMAKPIARLMPVAGGKSLTEIISKLYEKRIARGYPLLF